jgi:hypothetical protein
MTLARMVNHAHFIVVVRVQRHGASNWSELSSHHSGGDGGGKRGSRNNEHGHGADKASVAAAAHQHHGTPPATRRWTRTCSTWAGRPSRSTSWCRRRGRRHPGTSSPSRHCWQAHIHEAARAQEPARCRGRIADAAAARRPLPRRERISAPTMATILKGWAWEEMQLTYLNASVATSREPS